MKKAKRESVRKIEINHDLVMSARRKTFAINKKADIEIERNTSASKNYRITTNESQRLPSSPSMSIKFKNNAYDPMHRKFSGASDFYKGSRKRLLTIEIKTATNFEDSVSNASYMPDNRSRANKSGELFRHDASDQKSVAQETARKPISQDIRLSLAAPQTNLMLFDRKPSYRTQSKGLGPTESAESIPRSDRTMKPPKSSSGGKQLEINQSNSQMLTRKSQMFSISTSKHQQSPSGREISFGVSQGAPQQSVKVSAASRQPLRMFRRDQVDTSKVIEEAKSYHAIMNAAKKEKFMYSENIDVSQYRTNVLQDKFSKFRTRDVLQKFSFEKKKRVIGNLKEKIGKNRKMIQYEAKVLKSTNTADIGSFRKDLRLVIEEKYDFFVHIDKIKEIFKEKNNQYVPPLYKSRPVLK